MFCGTGFTVLAAWTKRNHRHDSVPLTQRVARAVLAGRAPASAVRAAWLPELDRSRRFWKALTVVALVLFPAMTALQMALLMGDAGSWREWALLTLFVTFGVLSPVQRHLQLRRIAKLRVDLETRLLPTER